MSTKKVVAGHDVPPPQDDLMNSTLDSSDEEDEVTCSDTDSEPSRKSQRGMLPDGTRFAVPDLVSVMRTLVHPQSWRSGAVLSWFAICILTEASLALYYTGHVGIAFYVLLFIFWRLAYNAGIGYMLHIQSKDRGFERFVNDKILSSPRLSSMLESSVVFLDSKLPRFKVKDYPREFTAWVAFRFVVMVILACDVLAYFLAVFVLWEWPEQHYFLDYLRWIVGLALVALAAWSKADAHRVIGDYAWYWGDFFFLLDKDLVFDGVFEMVPHPMYTVGYFFMYGFSLLSRSFPVFYISLFGHIGQMVFLTFVENPHIDKTYNTMTEPTEDEKQRDEILYGDDGYLDKKELVVFSNFNIFRSMDQIMVLLLGYAAILAFLLPAEFALFQAVLWRLFLTPGLGWVLREQTKNQRWTKYFGSPRAAFDNWKRIYNVSVTLTNACFLFCVYRFFQWESPFAPNWEWRVGISVIGLVCIGLHAYVSLGVFDALGDFGYYYGDFFIDNIPQRLTYSGIYRYMNNPDSTLGMLGLYGAALLSGSMTVMLLAVFSDVMVKLFQFLVEKPHMETKYGKDQLRSAGGLRAGITNKAKAVRQLLKNRRKEAKDEYQRAVSNMKTEVAKQKERYESLVEKVRANRKAEGKRKA